MLALTRLDGLVRERLQQWPQRPPGIKDPSGAGRWLRGRPGDMSASAHPFLKFPGSNRLRTLPDGLWLHFGGTPAEPYVDIFAVEACSSYANMLDKRSRFAPSTNSLLAVCPVPWLLAPAVADDPTPRWRLSGAFRAEPATPLVLPVRDIRVLYALKARQYKGFVESQIPHPHEYFMPMETLTSANAQNDPSVRELVARASTSANFLASS